METNTNQLAIESPCPMRLKSNGNGTFDCKSCNTIVKDFRGLSHEEIKAQFEPGGCGVFTEDQLPGQPPMVWHMKWRFAALTFLAFMGFSVSPLQAQTTEKPSDKTTQEAPAHSVKQDETGERCYLNKEQQVEPHKKRKVRRRKFWRRYVRGKMMTGRYF